MNKYKWRDDQTTFEYTVCGDDPMIVVKMTFRGGLFQPNAEVNITMPKAEVYRMMECIWETEAFDE